MQHSFSDAQHIVVAGYVRRSSEMQKDNYSIDAQRRALTDSCTLRGLPAPIFYEDDERSARGEQIAKRPAFKRLLDEVQAGRVQVVMVHTLDRWSRNVMVTLQSFRILAQHQTAFISLSEHIDYSTPEGRLQLTILAAFAAYFSDMLAKHTSKGKSERVAQGLYNGAYLITRGVRIVALVHCGKTSPLNKPVEQARLVYFSRNVPAKGVLLVRKEPPCSSSLTNISSGQALRVSRNTARTAVNP